MSGESAATITSILRWVQTQDLLILGQILLISLQPISLCLHPIHHISCKPIKTYININKRLPDRTAEDPIKITHTQTLPLYTFKPTMKLCFLLLSFLSFISFISSHPHPLDPLSPSELSTIRSTIITLNLSSSLSFHYVGLHEPNKSTILSFSPLSPLPPRRAFAILRADRQTHELTIDIPSASIISHRVYAGPAFPTFTNEEEADAGALPMNYLPFLESVKKRGIEIDDVICTSYTRGWFGEGEGAKRRRAAVLCFVGEGTANFYARPIEGLTIVVDLDDMKIVEYRDRVVVPVPKAEGTEYRAGKMRPPFGPRGNRVVEEQPEGKGFDIHGHMIR